MLIVDANSNINVQSDPCSGNYEPLFNRFWNGTLEGSYCNGEETENCPYYSKAKAVNQTLFSEAPPITNLFFGVEH